MRQSLTFFRRKESLLYALILLLIGIGVVLRLSMFFSNRNLIIDEANIVRNLAERDFMGLTTPLKYEQYAPPVFLWIEELMSRLLGFGEKAMRLYPLLCGLGTLFLFPAVAKKLLRADVIWLPLAYLAGGFIFVKYSAELKQYMPDTFIGLALIYAALRWDIGQMQSKTFILRWVFLGSVAIWSSMPSVFFLAGIGCYYAWQSLHMKRYGNFIGLALIAGVWLLQFGLYYITILKTQINSSYLQNYHMEYFLFGTPANKEEWLHNWKRIEDIMGNVGGWSGVAVVSNLLFFVLGLGYLIWKRTAYFLLLVLPIMLVLLAAALNQFSLIDRVILFMLPLWILVIGFGFQVLWTRRMPIKVILVLVAGYNAFAYMALHLLWRPYQFHEITRGMDWIKARGGSGNQLYVHDANVPTYIYYTELHPDKGRYAPLLGAHRMTWDHDYAEVTRSIKDSAYFLYTGGFPEPERNRRVGQIEQNMKQVAYYEYATCYVFVYVPKLPTLQTDSLNTSTN